MAYGISRSLLMTWRRSFRPKPTGPQMEEAGFVPAMTVAAPAPKLSVSRDRQQCVVWQFGIIKSDHIWQQLATAASVRLIHFHAGTNVSPAASAPPSLTPHERAASPTPREARTIAQPTNASRDLQFSANGRCRPSALPKQAKTRAIPGDQLDPFRTLCPEHVDRPRERVGRHGLAHQRRESIATFAEVYGLRCHHHRTAPAPGPMRTVTPSIITSIIRHQPRHRIAALCAAFGRQVQTVPHRLPLGQTAVPQC